MGIGKPVPPSGEELTETDILDCLCASKTQDEITVVSNTMTTFPFTLVDQVLAQGNLLDFQQLTCIKLQDKQKLFL